jgi:CRISPR/Cas system-associated exonuclease Cas4 (RecB family)
MRKIDCNICDNKELAVNDTIKIDGKVYCTSCFDSKFSDKKELENKLVEKEVDPTICSSCNKDFGDMELNKISTHPRFCPIG